MINLFENNQARDMTSEAIPREYVITKQAHPLKTV